MSSFNTCWRLKIPIGERSAKPALFAFSTLQYTGTASLGVLSCLLRNLLYAFLNVINFTESISQMITKNSNTCLWQYVIRMYFLQSQRGARIGLKVLCEKDWPGRVRQIQVRSVMLFFAFERIKYLREKRSIS